MRPIALLALAAVALAADPFDLVGFETGWKQVGPSGFAATGVASDGGRTVVAWGPGGWILSRDAGLTWSAPILPATGPVGAPGAVPVAIAGALVTSPPASAVVIRTVDGAVRTADGAPRNPAWGLGPVAAMAAGADGCIYLETADGVTAIQADRPAASAPGRLAAVFGQGALVVGQSPAAHLVTPAVAIQVTSPFRAQPPAAVALFAGPAAGAFAILADGTGLRWDGQGGKVVHLGTPPALQVTSWAGWAAKTGGVQFAGVGVATDSTGTVVVGTDAGGRVRRILPGDGLPAGLRAVAPVASPDAARYRLVGASDGGLFLYRSAL